MRVIGTAGHVDHGKSTLVHALTGIDPDRLQEEKSRGMTIDLGFAWVELPLLADGQPTGETDHVGIVDVPGHIDFIKNMLAGVGSIDAAVLVIAADEGVMPQTREHLAILDLLAVPDGVVALTKTDLIDDPEWLDLVELDIIDLLQGTCLAEAPIVRLSAVSSEGLDDLRLAIAATLSNLAPRRNRARPRLPIDRIFSLSGFGTIVTGTLSDGFFQIGDAVEILPAGVPARIRGLQTHRQAVKRGEPGSRLAINLSGVGTDEIRRGDVVAKPNTLQSTVLLDVQFRLLASAPRPLVHNQAVDFFSGAADVPARVRLLGTEQLEPGHEGWLQLRLSQPVVVTAGDRYILRQPSPSVTLGGGVVLSPQPRRRWRRFDPAVLSRLETLARGAPDEILLQTLTRQPLLTPEELFGQSGLDLEVAQSAYRELIQSQALVLFGADPAPVLVTVATWERIRERLQKLLSDYHRQFPLRRGISRGELRNRLQASTGLPALNVRLFNLIMERAAAEGLVGADDGAVWHADHSVSLTLVQQAMVEQVLAEFAAAPRTPPNVADVLHTLGGDEELLEMMMERGDLVRAGGVLFQRDAFEAMIDTVVTYARERGSITLAQTRDLLDTSRKYAQALLEEMDARRITRREGDERVLRIG